MGSLDRRLPWRAISAALLAAPALSLLAAVAVVFCAGSLFPLGLHTLVPVALVLPMPLLVTVALLGLLLAGLTYGARSSKSGDQRVGASQAALLVLAAQAFLMAAQLVVVGQVNGIPDAALTLLAAAALQAVVLALATGAVIALGMAFALAPAQLRGTPWLGSAAVPGPIAPVLVRSQVYRIGTRRGPPALPPVQLNRFG